MMSVTLLTVGKLKEGYLREAVGEYAKRLSAYARVEETELKEERIADESDATSVAEALSREGDALLSRMPRDAYRVALCVEGVQYDSVTLTEKLLGGADRTGKLCLVIGSSHGLDEKVKAACDLRLSFSKMTFPHQLMRVMVYEALYRCFTIRAGKLYHK